MTEKTPLPFKVENDIFQNQRAFTPLLDQITTGISDEETHNFNLSANQ